RHVLRPLHRTAPARPSGHPLRGRGGRCSTPAQLSVPITTSILSIPAVKRGSPMSIQDATPAPTFAERFPRLAKDVKHLQVREGEDPWTTKEVKALALGLIAESERLEIELEAADAALTQ